MRVSIRPQRVRVIFRGGLGNQLFQFSAGYALARDLALPLALSAGVVHNPRAKFPRHFELLDYELPDYELDSSASVGGGSKGAARDYWAAIVAGERCLTSRTLTENASSTRLRAPKFGCEIVLDGYWQSEDYFRERPAEIRSIFARPKTTKSAEEVAENVARDKSAVCVQVRRGDYALSPGIRKRHGLLGIDYFETALAQLERLQPVSQVFVFTDDPSWCEENLHLGYPQTVVRLAEADNSPANSLFVLSRGHRFVVSNSTFGWWGAWLSGVSGKQIIAPAAWFQDSTPSHRIVPSDWTRV